MDVSATSKLCTQKRLTFVNLTVLPDSRVIRTCGWDDSQYKNRCYQRSGFGGRQEVCACDHDSCNGSNLATVSFALVAGLVVLLQINRL